MRRILLCATLSVLMHAAAASAAHDAAAARSALQALAVEVKHTLDDPNATRTPAQIAQWRTQLARLADDANAAPASALAQKLRAATHLVDELAAQIAHPASVRTAPDKPARLDRESVSAARGASCANALGVSVALPVEIALAAAGQSGADAWLTFEPPAAGHVQFATDSAGADPALAVYRDCSAAPLAQNDDLRGLDAYVDVAVADRAPLYVHVSNGGSGGKIRVIATNADASLSGTVTDADSGTPLLYAQVQLFNPDGSYAPGYTYTDANGQWSITTYPGQYYVHVAASQHVAALYPAAQCSLEYSQTPVQNCDSADATLVDAVSAGTLPNIDVALGLGRRIAGVVRSQDNVVLPYAEVLLLDGSSNVLSFAFTDSSGRYLISAVPNGTYYLEGLGGYTGQYGSQLYDHVDCGGALGTDCDLGLATPVTIAADDLVGANFDLPRASSIHGSIHGPAGYSTYVYALKAGNQYGASGYADANGNYSLGPLGIGDYYVYAVSYGFFPQLYPGVDCTPDCPSDLAAGTKLSITQLGDSPQADFTLHPSPVQSGHVQDASTGLPLGNVFVFVSAQFPPAPNPFGVAFTNGNGDYALPSPGLGDYYVWAQSPDHIDQIYPAIACEQPNYGTTPCDVSGAVPMHVTPSTTTLPAKNFALQPSSTISGDVGVRATPTAAAGALVDVFDFTGAALGGANADANGHYIVADLAAGSYYARAQGYYPGTYLGQLWHDIDCPSGCDVTQGTPIALGASSTVDGIDFSLVRQDAVVGQVLDANNQPIAGVLLDLFDANSLAYIATGATDAQGNYLVAATYGGTYFLATEAPGAYTDQIWSGVACPLGPAYLRACPFTNATALTLALGATQPHVANFILTAPDEIFSGNFE